MSELNSANLTGTIGNGIVKYDLNSAVKAIQPLSEIVNYGAEYTYKSESYGNFETVKITADTKADDIIFVTKEGTDTVTFQFWDANGRQSVYGGACNGRNLVTVANDGSQITVFISAFGKKAFRYNSDGTFKNLYNGTFAENGTVLTRYNTDEYTPTADYHPATKKYVDDALSALTPDEDDTEDTALYFSRSNDALYYANVTAPGTATATETKLTSAEVSSLFEKAHTSNIIIFDGPYIHTMSNGWVYRVIDAYSVHGNYYFSVLKSDRSNVKCEVTVLCISDFNYN